MQKTSFSYIPKLTSLAFATALLAGCASANEDLKPLNIKPFNPGEKAIFQVASVIVEGESEVLLIDAQFSTADARKLTDEIKAKGKKLNTIYISHSDPDYYFGLEALVEAFPQAKIIATQQTIERIKKTKDAKLTHWGPILGENAPKTITIPAPLKGDSINLEGHKLEIVGLNGPTPDRSFVWIPSEKTVAGGIPVIAGEHVWMADTQTKKSHADWIATLDSIVALKPDVVIPGHYVAGTKFDISNVTFTADYIRAFDKESDRTKNSEELITAMENLYPKLGGKEGLKISAQVEKGEIEWQ